ncbi:MAG: lipopolysaccharide biosynthesis protein [Arenicellales bacterium]
MENTNKHYDSASISNSLLHFMVGKGFKVIASVSVLILLARYMEESQYAVYVSFQALIFLIALLSSAGFQGVLNRYLPELRENGNNLSMYRLMVTGLSLRLITLTGMMTVALFFIPALSEWFNFQDWAWVLPWYFFVGAIRISALSLSQSMESLLWQKDAQYSLAAGNIIRFFLVILFILFSKIDLVHVVIIEAITECMTLIYISYRFYRKWKNDEQKSVGNNTWWRENKKRVIRFGFLNYLVGQSTLLYGSAPNRLLLASYLPSANLAVYGFADGFANLSRRIMPTRLLIGFIRPVFIARYSSNNSFDQLNRMSNFIFRVNLMLIILPIILLLVLGEPIFSWLTAGKYGESAYVLAAFLILIIFESLYSQLNLILQALEKNQITVVGNILRSLSLFAAIPFLNSLGFWSLILANMVGSIAAIGVVVIYLWNNHYHFKPDISLIIINILYGFISGSLGWLVYEEWGSLVISLFTMIISYVALCLVKPPLYNDEKQKSKDLFLNSIRKNSNAKA